MKLDMENPVDISMFCFQIFCQVKGVEPRRDVFMRFLEISEKADSVRRGTYANDPRAEELYRDFAA